MGVRLFVGLLLVVLMPRLAVAADCLAVRQGDVALVAAAGCSDLRLMSRKRIDARPNVAVAATWVEFAQPSGPGEWRYNDWVHAQLATLNFDRPIALAPDLTSEDRFTLVSLYRSDRLISARAARRVCCAPQADTIYGSVNVDSARWTLFSPDELVSLGAAADACWRQFADDGQRGEAFARGWPLQRPWLDRDFEIRRIGHVMRELIGPVVVDPHPSKERTRRLFVAVLKDQARWSFGDRGATVDFGELLGYAAGPFFCKFANAELKAIARPGAAIPP